MNSPHFTQPEQYSGHNPLSLATPYSLATSGQRLTPPREQRLAHGRRGWLALAAALGMLALLLTLPHSTWGQCVPASFSSKTTVQGLGSNLVPDVFASGSTVYAATQGGLSISTDGGITFTNKTTANGLGDNIVYGVFASGSTVYAATFGGLSISTDGGMTFTNKTTANGLGNNWVTGVFASGSTVYAATQGGLSISTDGGMTFTNRTTANGLGSNSLLRVFASGSTVYAATNGGLSISTDGGMTFTNKTTANGLGNNFVAGVFASGSTVYAATFGGLSISTDGGMTFTNKTTANGLGNNTVTGVFASGSTVYAATNGGLSISTDGGMTFTNKTTANGLGNNFLNGVFASGSTVYAATQGSGLSIGICLPPPALNAQVGDPAVCLDPGGLVGIAATVTNPNNSLQPATFTATLPAGLTAVAGTCSADVNPGGCTIAANGGSVSWNGNLAAGQTVNIVYRARTDANAGQGSSFTINNTATVGGVPANLAYTFTLNCPNITNTRASDQKAGSVLVFPYYTSTVGGGSDTRMTISNISNAASTAANQAYVHLFFIDGTTCAQADLFLCLTPNASFSFKASEYDPGNTGYLLAVAVDRNGVPVQNNVLIGNAFVTTPTLADNYGAESFWANTFAVATVSGNTATLYFDQTGYDAVPKQFVAEVQSPLDAAGQQIITAGLSGNLATSTITGAAQVGSGLAFNEQEKFVSFQGWLLGTCQARATIATNSPRVPNGLGNLIITGQSGSLKFNVGAAVGLLLTPRTATWKGIRTLHKTQTTTTSLTIPIFVPVC